MSRPQHADVNVNKILIGNKCDMQDQRVSHQNARLECLNDGCESCRLWHVKKEKR
jgi:hypothetical protein